MRKEKSCGGLIFKEENGKTMWLVIRPKDKVEWWDFPKGHVEENETEEQTALREIYEEVGLKVKIIPGYKESITYMASKEIEKTVIFFLCEALTTDVKYVFDEMQDHKWLSYEEALTQLTFDAAKDLLRKTKEYKK